MQCGPLIRAPGKEFYTDRTAFGQHLRFLGDVSLWHLADNQRLSAIGATTDKGGHIVTDILNPRIPFVFDHFLFAERAELINRFISTSVFFP